MKSMAGIIRDGVMRLIEYVDCPKCKRRITSHTAWLHFESGYTLCQSCKVKSIHFVRSLGKDKAMAMSEKELMELFLKEESK